MNAKIIYVQKEIVRAKTIISPCVQDQSGLIIYIQYIIIYIQNEIVRASHYLSLCAGSERVMCEALQQLARAQLCEKEEERRKENAKILIAVALYICLQRNETKNTYKCH